MKYVSAYNEGISVAVRRGAPIASLSIDRRALYNYTEALNDATVASLICWCCARRFPYVEARRANEIEWTQPLQPNEKVAGSPWQFARMSMKDAERIFGLGAYLERYGDREAQAGAIYARREAECEEWTMEATWPGGKCSILGCPEDKVCKDAECMEGRRICSECKIPQCRECSNTMYDKRGRASLPAVALANDAECTVRGKSYHHGNDLRQCVSHINDLLQPGEEVPR